MPTIFEKNGFRFFFYSNDHTPIHVHVEKGASVAKFNLKPIELVRNRGFNSKDLRKIRLIIETNSLTLIQNWNEYFNIK